MWAFFVAVGAAQADTNVNLCLSQEVNDTRPAPGQREVPVDARVVATLVGECALGSYLAELINADGELVLSERFTPIDPPAAHPIVLHPAAPLRADTNHLLRITPSDRGPAVEVGFRTGAGRVVGLGDETPSLTVEDAFVERSGAGWVVGATARVDAVPDPDELSLVRVGVVEADELSTDLFSAVVTPGGAGVAWVDGWLYSDRRPDALCLEAAQIDGLGVETEVVTTCAPLEQRGCSAASARPGWATAALALLGLLRRARRRS